MRTRKKEPCYRHEPYFAVVPTIPPRPQEVRLKLPDYTIYLQTDTGVFSSSQVDLGTKILLEVAPPPLTEGDLLDLGCGYGPIAIVLAHRYPERTIWAIDVNERAIRLTQANVTQQRLTNVRVICPDAVPKTVQFAGIYANPPIRVGREILHDLLVTWLNRLSTHGRAYWVVKKTLGADVLTHWLTAQGYATARLRARRGYRVLESCPFEEDVPLYAEKEKSVL